MLRAAILSALLAAAGSAYACGVCVEDKMAAAYDHAIVTKALAQKHHVAFDPRRTTVAALQKYLERQLAARKLSLMLLRVLEPG